MLDSTHRRLPPTSLNLAPARAKYVPRTYNRFPSPARPQRSLYGCYDAGRRPRTPGRAAGSLVRPWSPVTHARRVERIVSHPVLLRGSAPAPAKSMTLEERKEDFMASLMGVALPHEHLATSETPGIKSPALTPLMEAQAPAEDIRLALAPISPTQLVLDVAPLSASPSSSCYSRPSAPASGCIDGSTAHQPPRRSPDKQLLFSPPPLSASFVVVQSLTPFLVWTPAPGAQKPQLGSATALASARRGGMPSLMSPALPRSAREPASIEALLSPTTNRRPPQSPLRVLCPPRSAAPLTGRLQASLLDVLDEQEEERDVSATDGPHEAQDQGEDGSEEAASMVDDEARCSVITFPYSSPTPWWQTHRDQQDKDARSSTCLNETTVEQENAAGVSLAFFSCEDLV